MKPKRTDITEPQTLDALIEHSTKEDLYDLNFVKQLYDRLTSNNPSAK